MASEAEQCMTRASALLREALEQEGTVAGIASQEPAEVQPWELHWPDTEGQVPGQEQRMATTELKQQALGHIQAEVDEP